MHQRREGEMSRRRYGVQFGGLTDLGALVWKCSLRCLVDIQAEKPRPGLEHKAGVRAPEHPRQRM